MSPNAVKNCIRLFVFAPGFDVNCDILLFHVILYPPGSFLLDDDGHADGTIKHRASENKSRDI